jgi:hypothetical protein
MPEGGDDDDDNDEGQNAKDEVAAKLNVDLSKPLRKGEDALPTIKAYERKSRYNFFSKKKKKIEGRTAYHYSL